MNYKKQIIRILFLIGGTFNYSYSLDKFDPHRPYFCLADSLKENAPRKCSNGYIREEFSGDYIRNGLTIYSEQNNVIEAYWADSEQEEVTFIINGIEYAPFKIQGTFVAIGDKLFKCFNGVCGSKPVDGHPARRYRFQH